MKNFNNIISIPNDGKINNELNLKVYLLGDGYKVNTIYQSIFNNKITNKEFYAIGDVEFKTEQFYWVGKYYKDLSKEKINILNNEI